MTRHTCYRCPHCPKAVSDFRFYRHIQSLRQHIRASHPGLPVFVEHQGGRYA